MKIYATKKQLIERSGKEASIRFKDHLKVHQAMQSIIDGFCECALSNHYSGGMWFSKTSDGVEWSIKFEQMGKRNKNGRIQDQRNAIA